MEKFKYFSFPGNNVRVSDLRGLLKFCTKFKCNTAIIITKDMHREEKIKTVLVKFIPAWYFLFSRAFVKGG